MYSVVQVRLINWREVTKKLFITSPYWTFISLVRLVENTYHVDGEGHDMIDEEEDYERNIDNEVGVKPSMSFITMVS